MREFKKIKRKKLSERMVRLELVGGGSLVGPAGLWANEKDTDLTFFCRFLSSLSTLDLYVKKTSLDNPCRVDEVKVHGLTVLLAPLLPMVREARMLQAGEGRTNITLEGVASKTLVNVLALLFTGLLNCWLPPEK